MIAPRRSLLVIFGTVALVAACSASGPSTYTFGGGSAAPSPGSSAASNACPTSQPPALPAGETRTVTIETAKGMFAIKVEADLSPIAAGNFVALAACGYYDGVVFHRLVPGSSSRAATRPGRGPADPATRSRTSP